ncbi:TPA: hypothetical protein MX214_001491 [Citrobacter sedlakii]|nr:hypothetical protein [Citrobacter sedlakii]HCA7135593.1 hypothetical protein [Citrobacter sedlakii]HCA7181082.1 hypothetical protein [Citrobacter sedlakii]
MMNYTGLYTPYKLNRPLTEKEKAEQFRQGKWRRVKFIMDECSVIRMNSVYMETVCKYYQGKGVASSILSILTFGILLMVLYGCAYAIYATLYEGRPFRWGGSIIIIIFTILAEYFLMRLLHKEWFRKTHYPIRFNRRNQMVYVYQVNGQIFSVPWCKVFFTPAKSKGAMSEWGIDGHILANDGETVIHTFSLAVSVIGSKKLLSEYWEFIRCYMEEDCVEDLADIVTLCPPVENRKEGYIFGLQYLLKMDSRLEWIFLPIMFPLNLLASIGRYIAMQTSKTPQWSQEVLDACQPDPDDPVNVSAANNPEHLWRYVLANEKREEYEIRHARQTAANERIKTKLAARYKGKSG